MIRFLSLVLICTISGFATAQEVQWASKVIEFSSELSPLQYSAKQALNKPNVLPNGGENPNACTPKNPNRIEFIKVGFERYQIATEKTEIQRQQGTTRRGQEFYPLLILMMVVVLAVEYMMSNRFYNTK